MSDSSESWYARFIRDSGCIRKADCSVKPQAFLDKRPPHNTSVSRHCQFKSDIHWDVGASIDPKRRLIGAADISKVDIESVKMRVVDTNEEGDPPYHTEIHGWDMNDNDEGKHARMEKARELADLSSYVEVPKFSAKTNISIIILQKNEALHIKRCIEKLAPLEPRQIFVVDCFSTDGSDKTAAEMGAAVVQREWPGLYAKQFNWALDNLPIEASWVLRLDADEYLYEDTIAEVKALLPKYEDGKVTDGGLPPDVTSLSLSRARVFCGRKIRFGGTAHIPMVRFFKHRIGRCQDRAMDEHIITSEGRDYRLKGEFADDNLNSMDWWREKHRGYAKREAVDAIAGEKFKTSKSLYYRFPRYLRACIYFSIRYFLLLGFLDGKAGWRWHFWQGLWYRWIVDREIGRMKCVC